jgi:hypothetical protein
MRITTIATVALVTLSISSRALAQDPAPVATQSPPQQQEPSSTSQSSMKLTYEETRTEKSQPPKHDPDGDTVLHGFRIGYGFVMNYDKPVDAFDGKSMKDQLGLKTPSHFLLGYEIVYRVVGHSWLNVLLIANGMVAGLEQSKLLPSGNLLIGAELKNSFQIGVGANLSPLKGSEAHVVAAAGWTPRVGTIYTPVHVFFIPDVEGNHRIGITTGVTF